MIHLIIRYVKVLKYDYQKINIVYKVLILYFLSICGRIKYKTTQKLLRFQYLYLNTFIHICKIIEMNYIMYTKIA